MSPATTLLFPALPGLIPGPGMNCLAVRLRAGAGSVSGSPEITGGRALRSPTPRRLLLGLDSRVPHGPVASYHW